ncbi:MAG: DUF4304 domain-containing protein [Oscillospiraceae bacterium]|nr:DUF4304 domain-containing protein [Oscillospiraceae bacterium]
MAIKKSIYVLRLDEIQKQVNLKCLKPNGFKKKGRSHCRRTADGLFQIITFQIGQSYCYNNNKFWVQIGIRVPEAFEKKFILPPEKEVYHDYECNIRSDLFRFIGIKIGKTEAGYNYDAQFLRLDTDNIEAIVNQIISIITNKVFPFFSELESRDMVLTNRNKYKDIEAFNNTINLETAMIYGLKGNTEKANEFISKQYNSSKLAGHKEYVQQIASNLKLTISKND